MTSRNPDQTALIAQYICETSIQRPDSSVLSFNEFQQRIALNFPTASIEEFRRGIGIANELQAADRSERRHIDLVDNPCACGEPGIVVLLGADGLPTGERRCFDCDLADADAEKRPCVGCGRPLNGEDVRAGITLCGACDPDEIGWYDERGGS